MSLSGLEVRLAASGEVSGFSTLMAAHHYLGPRGSGRLLRYIACLDGQPAVLATFGSAAWKCRPREEFLGWDDEQRAARLGAVAGNQRLCVLPAGRQRNLASAALAAMLRRLPADHLAACGRPLAAVETFTDPDRGSGAVYAASGFTPVGLTAGTPAPGAGLTTCSTAHPSSTGCAASAGPPPRGCRA
jgi:GNAT superfamily N-acetyltransferase